MIPYAILSGKILKSIDRDGYNQIPVCEFRILDLAYSYFTFRLARKESVLLKAVLDQTETLMIELHFFDFKVYEYVSFTCTASCLLSSSEEFYDVYEVTPLGDSEEKTYEALVQRLTDQYMNYIHLKLEEPDAVMSKELTGYPAELEDVYDEGESGDVRDTDSMVASDKAIENSSLVIKDEKLTEHIYAKSYENKNLSGNSHEMGLLLDHPGLWQKYLSMPLDDFRKEIVKAFQISIRSKSLISHLTGHVDCAKELISHIKYLYFGSAYCLHLLPSKEEFLQLLEKCYNDGMTSVIVLPPMPCGEEGRFEEYLDALEDWDLQGRRRLELVINDWGMLTMIRQRAYHTFDITLGNLLHKRRKDARIAYKKGFEQNKELLSQTSMDDEKYRAYLREQYGVIHLLYESCGYPFNIREDGDLMLPYYQMNTAGHCTLYASCTQGDRGRQRPVEDCPRYCLKYAYTYPKSVNMTGRYNTLFGLDQKILEDEAYLQSFLKQKFRRVILNMLL